LRRNEGFAKWIHMEEMASFTMVRRIVSLERTRECEKMQGGFALGVRLKRQFLFGRTQKSLSLALIALSTVLWSKVHNAAAPEITRYGARMQIARECQVE
jgi:hypothetical protein